MSELDAEVVQGAATVTSLRRGLHVLGCFGQGATRLSLAQIAAATGLSTPTAWRYCYTLRKLGYLVRHANETFSIGLSALGLGFAAISNRPFGEVILPGLQDLAERFGCTAILGQATGSEVTYLQMSGGRITLAEFGLGRRAPFAASPTGWACLAAMSRPERDEVLGGGAARPRLPAGFTAATAGLKAQGYMVTEGLPHPAMVAVSVPVRLHAAAPVYALTCGDHASAMGAAVRSEVGLALLELGRSCLDYLAGFEAAG